MLVPAFLPMPVRADSYSCDFSSGSLPKDMKVENANSLIPLVKYYKRGYTKDGWMVDRVWARGNCAISPTHTGSEEACDNTLTLPPLTVGKGWIFRISACSVYSSVPDALEIRMRHIASGAIETLLKVDTVPDDWTTYVLPLDCEGEEVELTIAAVSTDGFMLAVSDVFAGVPKVSAEIVSRPRIYYGLSDLTSGSAHQEVSLLNTGCLLEGASLAWYAEGERVGSSPLPTLKPGETAVAAADIPLTIDQLMVCTLVLEVEGEEDMTLLDNVNLFASDYARTLVVDEATGMWCTNCPEGQVALQNMEKLFGNALIPLVTHEGDPLELKEYWDSLKFYAIPYFKLNRNAQASEIDLKKFSDYYWLPTLCNIDVTHMWENADGSLSAEVEVKSSSRFETEGKSYGVGCTVTRDFKNVSGSYQKNNATRPASGPYYYLNSPIPGDMLKFNDVTVSSQYAFSPVPETVKDRYDGRGERFVINLERPEMLDDWKQGRFVAYVMDCETGEVENACAISIDEATSTLGLTEISSDRKGGTLYMKSSDGNRLEVTSLNGGTVEISAYTPEGVALQSLRLSLEPGETRAIPLDLPSGLTLVKGSTRTESVVCRIIR